MPECYSPDTSTSQRYFLCCGRHAGWHDFCLIAPCQIPRAPKIQCLMALAGWAPPAWLFLGAGWQRLPTMRRPFQGDAPQTVSDDAPPQSTGDEVGGCAFACTREAQ